MNKPFSPANPRQVCIITGKCSKTFLKNHAMVTSIDKNGFPSYRRRDNECYVEKNEIKLNNRYGLPCNKKLMIQYREHMNVEWCIQTRVIKYLFKYIHKGPDYVYAAVDGEKDGVVDEIKRYLECRYTPIIIIFFYLYFKICKQLIYTLFLNIV